MKQKLLSRFKLRALMLVTLLCAVFTGAWADEKTITFSELSLENGVQYSDPFTSGDISVTFAGGANDGKYYTTGSGIRTYGGGTITIEASGQTITKIALKFSGESYAPSAANVWSCTGGSGTGTSGVEASWSGSATKIVLTRPSGSGHWRLQSVTVTYNTGSGSQKDDCDLALTGAPVALTFDLYNNATAQTIHYTTSSTGEVSVETGQYDVSCYVDNDAKTISVTPFAVTNGTQTVTVNQAADGTYKAGSVTFTVTVTNSTPKTGAWVLTNLADLEDGDIFVIVGNNGDNYAMSNNNGTGSAPTVVAVVIENNEITSDVDDNIKWSISGNATDGYTFYPNGDTEKWLYCTNNNNGVRVGTNDAKLFSLEDGYLKHNGTSRYVGVYNNQDWRCYTNTTGNIAGQTFAFYKYEDGTTPQKADPGLSFSPSEVNINFGDQFTAPTLNAASGFNGTVEYSSSDESVALVMDTETGDLRIMGGGTTTITATFAGNNDFKSGSASYTLNVTDNRIATTITQDNITIDIADIATLTQLTPVVKDANNNVVSYTNSPTAEGLPEVYFEQVSDDNRILGSFDSHGNIVLNSVVGTATIKAVYNHFQLNDNYRPSECTFTITIVDPNAPGAVNNPYTVADVLALFDNNTVPTTEVYVSGIISEIKSIDVSKYTRAQYYISDDGSTTDQFYVYNGLYLNGENFTANDQIQVGDEVVVYGQLTTYSGTNEFAANNYIYSLNRPAPPAEPTITLEGATNNTIEYNAAYESYPWGASYAYTVENYSGNSAVQFTYCDASGNPVTDTPSWFNAQISDTHLMFYCRVENTSSEARYGYVKMFIEDAGTTYYSDLITVKQKGATPQPTGDLFVKVTSTADLTDGDYLIVYEDGALAFNGGLTTLDAVGNTISVTIANDAIAKTDENYAARFTIATVTGGFSLQAANGQYIGQTSDANGLKAQDEAITNTISITADGDALISAGGAYLRYNAASTADRFRYYKSSTFTSQQPIALYKFSGTADERQAVTLTFDNVPSEININETATYAAISSVDGLTITYASSDDDIVMVDANTGEIGALAVGEATITATFAGDNTYKPASASYTITVVDPSNVPTYYALVAQYNGKFYAMNEKGGATWGATEVDAVNGKVVSAQTDEISWEISPATQASTSKVILKNVSSGKYLNYTSSASLSEGTTSANWDIDETNHSWLNNNNRSMVYRESAGGFKNYAVSNINTSDYSDYTHAYSFADGYVRAVTANKYGTFCVDHTIAADDYSGVKFYSIAGKVVNSTNEPTSIVLKEETGELLAGVAYIFQANDDAAKLVAAYSDEDINEPFVAADNNGLAGSFTGTAVDEGKYLLSNGQIVKCGTGCSIGANRAYIDMDLVPEYNGAGNNVKMLGVDGFIVDGINATENGQLTMGNAKIFNIAGQRLQRPVRGINIINGKKVLVK